MRLVVIAATLLLATTTFAALAPTASAVAWCSEALNPVRQYECQHLVCWGRSYNWQTKVERCQLSEDNLPDPCRPCCCDLLA